MAERSYTVIHDSVHGSVRMDDSFASILDSPELQRMGHVHQLGLANLVFPGANHTRLEHMLGTYHLASLFSERLRIGGQEKDLLLAAALVHDAGHPPFSHTFEDVLRLRLGINHMELSARIIMGEMDTVPSDERYVLSGSRRICESLESMGLSPKEVAQLVMLEEGTESIPGYLTSLIHGPVDVDQLDYLMRDSHYTGVAQGSVDAARIIETSSLADGVMVVERRGMAAVEGLTVSRILMNSAVYFHRTVRIAEMMLAKAVSMLDRAAFVDVFRDTDASLSERLKANGGYQREVALRLKYRRLFKSSLQLNLERMSPDERKRITVLSAGNRLARMEDELSALAGGEPGSVIIDIAPRDFLARRRRKGKTEVPILDDDGKVRKLTSLSPIARAVQMHPPQSWGLMVACDPAIRPQISRMAYDAIFG